MIDKGLLFRAVWRGWFVGATVVLVPLMLLAALLRPEAPVQMFVAPLLVPLITAIQGIFVGALVVLGVTIWPMRPSAGG